jgi:predicted alpha/beta hydrolase family esterase
MALLFLHGAGGFDFDRPLADALAAELGTVLLYPRLSDDDPSVPGWAAVINPALDELSGGDVLVAHSFGATVLLHVLADRPAAPVPALLLATPNWGPEGWDSADYAFTGPPPPTPVVLHHCRDDEEVPFAHLELNRAALPAAAVHVHDDGGHQFAGQVPAIAASARGD